MILMMTLLLGSGAQDPGGSPSLGFTRRDDLVPVVRTTLAAAMPDLVAFYRECHAHPELSGQEEQTATRTARALQSCGLEVTRGVGGHGVVGVLKNGAGPVVLVRGDMDALPVTEDTGLPYASAVRAHDPDAGEVGVMHACGHDMHQTCLVGTARVLAALKDRWRGTLVAIAQPAEETGHGARAMIDAGLFERFPRPNACIALHVTPHRAGTVICTPGYAWANVDSIDVTIWGRGGHGSRPHQTVDPVVVGSHVVVALQSIVSRRVDPLEPAVITVGSFHAGAKHNVIADRATLLLTVRSYGDAMRDLLLRSIREVVLNTCRAHGAPRDPDIVLRDDEYTPASYNDPALTEAATHLFLGLLGPDAVSADKPMMGGEDFGRYAKHLGVPGFMFRLGTISAERLAEYETSGAGVPSLHSGRCWPDVEPSIDTGVTCLANLALALLENR